MCVGILLLWPISLLPLAAQPPTADPAAVLAGRMWAALESVGWNTPYRPRPGCVAAPVHTSLGGGLQDYAYLCSSAPAGLIAESFYYPVGDEIPVVVLRRADFRPADPDPAIGERVEQLLRLRLTRKYGAGVIPGHLYEIGADRPSPGLSWQAGAFTIFLHRNRLYVAPSGIREGVQLIAVRNEVLELRQRERRTAEAFYSSTSLSHPATVADLQKDVGAPYLAPPAQRPASEVERVPAERKTRLALIELLRQADEGDRERRAAVLYAADDLAVRLANLLVMRSIANGAESLAEALNAPAVRKQLAPYGVRYTGFGHYSGELEYDRSLLRRTWLEFPGTAWGQRAFLSLQLLVCSDAAQFQCDGPNCFRQVIQRGEQFLRDYPRTPFRKEQIYHLALAHETWWSLSQAAPDDPTAEGAQVDKASAAAARQRAIELYEELIRLAPESPEAERGRLRLTRLKLALDTGERAFFCFTDL
jgi:hypothetical protein